MMEDKETAPESPVLALVADLIFAARVRGAAPPGVDVRATSRAQQLREDATRTTPRLILVDLGAKDDPIELIRWIRGQASLMDVPVVAFGAHVDAERLSAARAAGATRVLARSAFTSMLPALLEGGRAG